MTRSEFFDSAYKRFCNSSSSCNISSSFSLVSFLSHPSGALVLISFNFCFPMIPSCLVVRMYQLFFYADAKPHSSNTINTHSPDVIYPGSQRLNNSRHLPDHADPATVIPDLCLPEHSTKVILATPCAKGRGGITDTV